MTRRWRQGEDRDYSAKNPRLAGKGRSLDSLFEGNDFVLIVLSKLRGDWAHNAEGQASSVLKAGPTTPRSRPSGDHYSIMRNTMNEGLLRDNLEGGDNEKIRAAA